MSLNIHTEELTCDTDGCNQTTDLTTSVSKGWYFTVEDVENHHIATHTDYCPTHAKAVGKIWDTTKSRFATPWDQLSHHDQVSIYRILRQTK